MPRPSFTGGASSRERTPHTPQDKVTLSDDILLQICKASVLEAETMPEWVKDLRKVPQLIGCGRHESHLGLALTMLAALLGELPRHNPTHLPFGFGGPRVHSHHWIEEETLDRIGKQIVGLVQHDRDPNTVAIDVEYAIRDANRLGFLDQKRYDAWRPGMASGSGWRTAVMATPYGTTKARMLASSLMEPDPDDAGEREPDGNGLAPTPASVAGNDAQSTEPEETPSAGATPAAAEPDSQAEIPSIDERYAWARQIDLVNAANQVLGEGMLNKGVLSRACRSKRIETNGRSGRASRVSAAGFLTWIVRQFSISHNEQIQIRNAIIGEINARNS